MYLVTAKEMQKMDRLTTENFGIPGRVLMENAGRGAAEFFYEKISHSSAKRVGIFAGRGNNGGDGFVIARCLHKKGVGVVVYLLSEKSRVKGDARENLNLLEPLNIPVYEVFDNESFADIKTSMIHQEIFVDAILGTGLKSDVKGFFKKVIEFINSLKKPVLCVDIPSGLNSDTGLPCGVCIRAFATATFGFAKTGNILYPGAKYTGSLKIIDIGIPDHIAKEVEPLQYLLTEDFIRSLIIPRQLDAHKGSTGHLLIVAGSAGKTGAAAMTAESAMRAGAGLVSLAIPASLNPILESVVLEAMTHPLPESRSQTLDMSSFETIIGLLSNKESLAIGPGLGTDAKTKELTRRVIEESPVPVVVDADGLNSFADDISVLKNIRSDMILTPHPGEMAKLVKKTVREIQQDRINCARDFAVRYNLHLVLKGAKTVIAHPDGKVYVNRTGNPGMASGGMGDVLTGIIAGLITQGYSPKAAAHIGVYMHGAAADDLAEKKGPVGYLARDVMDAIPRQFKKLQAARN